MIKIVDKKNRHPISENTAEENTFSVPKTQNNF